MPKPPRDGDEIDEDRKREDEGASRGDDEHGQDQDRNDGEFGPEKSYDRGQSAGYGSATGTYYEQFNRQGGDGEERAETERDEDRGALVGPSGPYGVYEPSGTAGPSFERGYYRGGTSRFEPASETTAGVEGLGPPNEWIHDEVCARLYADPRVQASRLEVAVSGGLVTLQGMVESGGARDLAGEIAAAVPGVKEVANTLRVHRPDAPPVEDLGRKR